MKTDSLETRIGKAVAREFWRSLSPYLLFVITLQLLWVFVPIGRDSTDGRWRSGMAIKTDCLTGLQYLSGGGGLTPRIGADGAQMKEACK